MYHEEKLMNGRWYFRGTPDGEWIQFDESHYVDKIAELEDQLYRLRSAERSGAQS